MQEKKKELGKGEGYIFLQSKIISGLVP